MNAKAASAMDCVESVFVVGGGVFQPGFWYSFEISLQPRETTT